MAKAAKVAKLPKLPRIAAKRESKRLTIHERNVRSKVTNIRPAINLGKRIRLTVLVSVVVLFVLVIVAVFSPLLAVRKIEIVGANRVSEAAIQKDLKYLLGKPLPQVSSDEIAAKLANYQLIDSISAESMPPNTLRVVVIERSPIAKVVINGVEYLYDPAGVQLGRAAATDQLPVILNSGNPASSPNFKSAIAVLLKIPASLIGEVASISAQSKDNVVLQLRSANQKILWGDDSKPGLKAKVLTALMKHYDHRWGITFDVSSPGQPSVY